MRLRSTLAVAIGLSLVSAAASAQFSNTYIFGDSLSDAGQYGARFTTNPGLTFPMYLAERYGLAATPSFTGGNDFAQGGARVNAPSPLIPTGAPNLSIAQQVTGFLAHGPIDPNALYQIQGGANDFLVLSGQFAAGAITAAQVQAGMTQAALDLATQVARLQAAGARNIVVYGLPDIGLSPAAASQGSQANGTAITNLFNNTLSAALAAGGLQVIQVNTAQLLREVVANPASFGFTNVTVPVCTTTSAVTCTPSTLRDPAGALTWAFADGIHPTTGLAQIGAQAAASMIEAPVRIGQLAEAPIAVEQAAFRAIDGRMIGAVGAPRAPNKFDAWVSYDYASQDVSGTFLGGDSTANTIAVGGDIKLSDSFLVGVAFNYTENKSDFGASAGDFKLKETAATVYAGYGKGPWWVGATFGAGDLDYDVRRGIQLGALSRTETGHPNGSHIMASVLGGYWFAAGTVLHGPFARVAWQEINVDAFTEGGNDSTALSYGEQKRRSLISSLGWQVAGQLGAVRPFGRITWDFESQDDERSVRATPVGLNTSYTMTLGKPDDSYVRYLIGGAMDFSRVTGYITAEGTSGRDTGNGYAITVGVRVPP